uniref:Uncharacterized protein n=1 Tax=Amphimedon queenslandica TaxID=400682 RepID=A0A1X7SQD0_AMPQE
PSLETLLPNYRDLTGANAELYNPAFTYKNTRSITTGPSFTSAASNITQLDKDRATRQAAQWMDLSTTSENIAHAELLLLHWWAILTKMDSIRCWSISAHIRREAHEVLSGTTEAPSIVVIGCEDSAAKGTRPNISSARATETRTPRPSQ